MVSVWQWLTAQQERQWTFTRPTTIVVVAALERQVVMSAAEQVAATTDELTVAPAQVQVLVAAVDLVVVAGEVKATVVGSESGDCMRALFGSQDLAVVAIEEEAAATAVGDAVQRANVELLFKSSTPQRSRRYLQEPR